MTIQSSLQLRLYPANDLDNVLMTLLDNAPHGSRYGMVNQMVLSGFDQLMTWSKMLAEEGKAAVAQAIDLFFGEQGDATERLMTMSLVIEISQMVGGSQSSAATTKPFVEPVVQPIQPQPAVARKVNVGGLSKLVAGANGGG